VGLVALVVPTLLALRALLAVQACLFLLPYLLQTIALLLAVAVAVAVAPVIPSETIMAVAVAAAVLLLVLAVAVAADQGRVQAQEGPVQRVL
jgi:hypothetical protein